MHPTHPLIYTLHRPLINYPYTNHASTHLYIFHLLLISVYPFLAYLWSIAYYLSIDHLIHLLDGELAKCMI